MTEAITTTSLTHRSMVRSAYSQCAVWRPALGEQAGLYPFVTFECGIDAPERGPSGSMKPGYITDYPPTIEIRA